MPRLSTQSICYKCGHLYVCYCYKNNDDGTLPLVNLSECSKFLDKEELAEYQQYKLAEEALRILLKVKENVLDHVQEKLTDKMFIDHIQYAILEFREIEENQG